MILATDKFTVITDAHSKRQHYAADDCNCQPVCPRHHDDDDDGDDDDVHNCDEMGCDAGTSASPTKNQCDTMSYTIRLLNSDD